MSSPIVTEIITKFGNQPAPCRGLPGPPGPKCRKSLENVSWGLLFWDPKKSQKKSGGQSGKSQESLRKVSGECFWSVPGLFGDCLGSGPGPGRHFRDFFGISGPEGPGDLCKGRAGSQYQIYLLGIFPGNVPVKHYRINYRGILIR